MTQAESDKILREQLPKLEAIRAQLSAPGAPAHHQATLKSVDAAIAKLKLSLKIR
jgi:hypothetical protein